MRTLLSALSVACVAFIAAGCATTDTSPAAPAVKTAQASSDKMMHTGSRIPSKTTEKLVKSTETDKADEPVRSLGNVVGGSSR